MTIEAALSLTVLIVVFAAIVAGVATLAAQISAIDAAGAAARAEAIGVASAPGRAQVTIEHAQGWVTARARVGSPLGTREAIASFPEELAGSTTSAATPALPSPG